MSSTPGSNDALGSDDASGSNEAPGSKMNIGARVLAYAASHPDAPAVRAGGVTTTYGQLAAHGGAIAGGLRRSGVRAGDRVALGLVPGPGFVAAVLAVAALGATYVPLDGRHASRRLTDIVEQARCRLVVVDAAFPAAIAGVPLDDVSVPAPPLTEADLVDPGSTPLYVMFTSGSTGVPKGVLIDHGAVIQLIDAIRGELTLRPGLVWSLVHSIAFDFSTWEMWGALLTGGVIAAASPSSIADPRALAEFIAVESVAVLSQTPSSFRRITADPELIRLATLLGPTDGGATVGGGASVAGDSRPGNLRYVVFGGEALPSSTLRPWVEQVGYEQPQLINMYGITETSVHTTLHRVGPPSLARTHVPIGAALPGRRVVVRTGDGTQAPAGTVGELYVGGGGLALGYLDDPELTARRFVATDHGTFYRSGDLGWLDDAGVLHHAGRMDREIKVRGHRIALEEVEAGVRRLPGVRDAVAVALDHPTHGGNILIAYVTGEVEAPDALQARLRDQFPVHMVPTHVIPIAEIPLNANGKLDTDRLPSPWASAPVVDTGDRGDDPESVIRQAFADVLGYPLDEIGPDADFFALGGDSLLAAYVFDAARWLRARLSIADLFDDPTPSGLARRFTAREETTDRQDATDRDDTTARGTIKTAPDIELPLTRAQEGLLVEWLHGQPTMYQVGLLVHLDLRSSADRVAHAILALGGLHPVLRTQIDIDAIGAEVRIGATADVSVIVCDEVSLDGARQWIADVRGSRFDLGKDALLRFRVGTLADGTLSVAIVGHHIICDGWSLSVLVRDIVDAVRDGVDAVTLTERGQRHLAVLAATPEREAEDIERYQRDAGAAPDVGWTAHVAGSVGADGPLIDRARTLGPEIHRRAITLARAARAPVKSAYVAAHLLAVADPGRADFAACIALSGRPDLPDAQTCVGYFVRPRILDVTTRGDRSAADFVSAVWRAEQQQLATRHAPIAVQLEKRGAHGRQREMPPVLMNYVDFHILTELGPVLLAREAYDENSFPLTVDVVAGGAAQGREHGTRITVRGRVGADVLDRLAADHVTALIDLVA